jgi:hypothetical protein
MNVRKVGFHILRIWWSNPCGFESFSGQVMNINKLRKLATKCPLGLLWFCDEQFIRPLPLLCRLSSKIQQGVFLAPMNLNRSFIDNLCSVAKAETFREHVFKLEIPITHPSEPLVYARVTKSTQGEQTEPPCRDELVGSPGGSP